MAEEKKSNKDRVPKTRTRDEISVPPSLERTPLGPFQPATQDVGATPGATGRSSTPFSLFSEDFKPTVSLGPLDPDGVLKKSRLIASSPWGRRGRRSIEEGVAGRMGQAYQLFPEKEGTPFGNILGMEFQPSVGRGKALKNMKEKIATQLPDPSNWSSGACGSSQKPVLDVPGETKIQPYWEDSITHAPLYYQMSRHVSQKEDVESRSRARHISERSFDADTLGVTSTPRKRPCTLDPSYENLDATVSSVLSELDSCDLDLDSNVNAPLEVGEVARTGAGLDDVGLMTQSFRNLSIASPEKDSSSDSSLHMCWLFGLSPGDPRVRSRHSSFESSSSLAQSPDIMSFARDLFTESHVSQPSYHSLSPESRDSNSPSVSHDASAGIARRGKSPLKSPSGKVEHVHSKNKKGRCKFRKLDDALDYSKSAATSSSLSSDALATSSSLSSDALATSSSLSSSALAWVPSPDEETPPDLFSQDDFPNLQRTPPK